MFSRWGAFVYRRRRPVALLALALALSSLAFATRASDELSSGGWLDPGSESALVGDRLAEEFGGSRSSLLVVFRADAAGADATSPAFLAALDETLAPLRDEPVVERIVGFAETGDRRFISTNGELTYAVVGLTVDDEESVSIYPELRAQLDAPDGYSLLVSGYAPFTIDQAKQAEEDLTRGELVSLPLAVTILLAVFGSLVAAGLPLAVGALAIPSTLALVYFVAQATTMATFALNTATMLGLALAIDYSLFIVSRFREELARGRSVALAVERAVGTSGKAVVFSGIAVAIGLSGLLVFPFPAIRSIGIAATLVVACSVFYALTFLPALLGMLGPRVNSLSAARLLVRIGIRPEDPGETAVDTERSRWGRLARAVMRRPFAVLVPVLALLLALGSPFLRLEQGVPGAETMPPGLESREAFLALEREFAPGETRPVTILVDAPGEATGADAISAVSAFADRVRELDGVTRVDSPFTLVDPASGAPLPLETVQALYAAPESQRPPFIAPLLEEYVRGGTVRLTAISSFGSADQAGSELIREIRALDADGLTVAVGGPTALGTDFLAGQSERIPFAVGWTMLATALILFLLFGSIAIPLKAVLMTLLSATASFGALVWIFQEGNLRELLAFEPVGYTISGLPVIMFSIIFGLSMDYEVLLLSRIQEAYRRTGDNTASVAEGLVRTARVITGAALIMVAVFAAFALAEDLAVKSVGVGMAIAVLIDATIVRVLLVPSTMRLLGKWNWWAPGPLKALADRIGFDHVEDEDEEPATRRGRQGATSGA
ncbi:MAG: hypothetical protein RL338_902 [Chloroflexota bacterium]